MDKNELKAKLESTNSMEEVYTLAKESGFTGSMEELNALFAKAASEKMDLDDLDAVAGGNAFTNAVSGAWDWCKANPDLAVTVLLGVAVSAATLVIDFADQLRTFE